MDPDSLRRRLELLMLGRDARDGGLQVHPRTRCVSPRPSVPLTVGLRHHRFRMVRQRRRLLDTFGDSLKYVNKKYTKRYGPSARKVPSHMPHMIDINIMAELQEAYAFGMLFPGQASRQANLNPLIAGTCPTQVCGRLPGDVVASAAQRHGHAVLVLIHVLFDARAQGL